MTEGTYSSDSPFREPVEPGAGNPTPVEEDTTVETDAVTDEDTSEDGDGTSGKSRFGE